MALIALYHEDLVLQPWMTFVAYQVLNAVTAGIVMFGNRFIPVINRFSCELRPFEINVTTSLIEYQWYTFRLRGSSPWSSLPQWHPDTTTASLYSGPG